MESALSTAADIIAQASSTAKAGIGFADSETAQDIQTSLSNTIDESCGTAEAQNAAKYGNITFLADSKGNVVNFALEGDVTTQCKLTAIESNMSKIDALGNSTAEGLDPTAMLIALAVVAVVGLAGYLILKKSL